MKTNPQRGGYWQPVTGTVEPHEGYFEAACREPIEETAFTFQSAPLDVGYEFEFTSQYGVTRERVFALLVDDEPTPVLDPKEHTDALWTTPEIALTMIKYATNIDGLRKSFFKIFNKPLETKLTHEK